MHLHAVGGPMVVAHHRLSLLVNDRTEIGAGVVADRLTHAIALLIGGLPNHSDHPALNMRSNRTKVISATDTPLSATAIARPMPPAPCSVSLVRN